MNLVLEFGERKTKEAIFAFYCDKLECDLQSKLYDEEECIDLEKQEGNPIAQNEEVQKLLSSGLSFSEMWITFGQNKYHYDENFQRVSEYAKKYSLKHLGNKKS
ncbi:MAG: hypothetical protein KH135_05270 [Firmicutes bacterium]|nr:hypothetical protein [Bacillota bacterium]